jgi:FixJ family two-component response regulator
VSSGSTPPSPHGDEAKGDAPRPAVGAREAEPEPIVYVVDDDPSVRRALSRLIRSVGLLVETFATAQAFLDSPPRDQPACLVLDVRLPGPSGLDLQSALREAGRPLPIVFITAHGSVATSVRAMKGGAVDFLQKPFNDQELLDSIQRALVASRRQRADQAEHAELAERHASLTTREREVLKLVVAGLLNKQIAGELGIAEKTIKVHRARVMDKMRVATVPDLVRLAEKLGLRSPRP